jgi:uncharacterized protein YebE (UPF0316 family)
VPSANRLALGTIMMAIGTLGKPADLPERIRDGGPRTGDHSRTLSPPASSP